MSDPSRPGFIHQRHKPGTELERPREIVVACVPMRSNVNISQIARTAGTLGIRRLIVCGHAKLIGKIARDADETLVLEVRRSLPPVLGGLREQGYRLVGLEQATHAHDLHGYRFETKTALIIGNERLGIAPQILSLLDDVVEIPVYGTPLSYNAATAAAMAMYEYCRQFPGG